MFSIKISLKNNWKYNIFIYKLDEDFSLIQTVWFKTIKVCPYNVKFNMCSIIHCDWEG